MKKNNPKQTAEAKLKRLINETVKKQLKEWSDNDIEELETEYKKLKNESMKRTIKLTESELHEIIKESVKRILSEARVDYEAAKYNGKWSVFDKKSRTYSHIGCGKKKATAKANELNDYCDKTDKAENENKTSNESIIRDIIKESVKRILSEARVDELDPRTYANYARGRQQQADNATDDEQRAMYQRKANRGVQAAQDAWNQKYGYSYQNGNNDWGETKMGGANEFVHNASSDYGINHRSKKNGTHTNLAYNPKTNQEWQGDGKGNSTTRQSSREMEYGDNGAYQVAREMENGTGKYVKGQGYQPQ